MWILRFHLLKSNEYNKILRICKKNGFSPRIHSSILFAKASIKHCVQKTSFRSLSHEYGIDHAQLAKFYKFSHKTGCLNAFFHVFLKCRSCLYIENNKEITYHLLHHDEKIIFLTQKAFEDIIRNI